MYFAIFGMLDCCPNEVRNRKALPGAGQVGGLAAHDFGDARLGGERRNDLDGSGIAGAEQHVRRAVQRLLGLPLGDACVRLRVDMGDDDLARRECRPWR